MDDYIVNSLKSFLIYFKLFFKKIWSVLGALTIIIALVDWFNIIEKMYPKVQIPHLPQPLLWATVLILFFIASYKVYSEKDVKTKLNSDYLYQKYEETYNDLIKFLRNITTSGKVTNEILNEFKEKIVKAEFTLEKRIFKYLRDDVYIQASEFGFNEKLLEIRDLSEEMREQLNTKRDELLDWFKKQLDEAKRKFENYLKIN